MSGKFLSILLSLAMWLSCVNGREHWEQYFSFVRVGFRPIAERRLRHWLLVLRIFECGPGAAQLDLLEKLMMYLMARSRVEERKNASCVVLDIATTFSRDEKIKTSPLVSAHPS